MRLGSDELGVLRWKASEHLIDGMSGCHAALSARLDNGDWYDAAGLFSLRRIADAAAVF